MELRGTLQSSQEVARQKLLSSKEKVRSIMTKTTKLSKIKWGRTFFFLRKLYGEVGLGPQYVGPYEVLAVEGVNVVIKSGAPHINTHK